MNRKKFWLFVPFAIAAMVLFVFVGGTVVQQLWNWLLPPLFGWRELTFWQALGMLALCRILFGGFGGGGKYRRRYDWTPEEKERFRQRMADKCGWRPPVSETPQQ
jgi:hypothetical protein